jgi:hypothetical protein
MREVPGADFAHSFVNVPTFAAGHLRKAPAGTRTHDYEHLTATGWKPLLWPGMGMEHAHQAEIIMSPPLIVAPTLVTPATTTMAKGAPVSQHLLKNLRAIETMARRGTPGEAATAQAILKKIQQANRTAK